MFGEAKADIMVSNCAHITKSDLDGLQKVSRDNDVYCV
jgi:hypothetical protein